MTEGLQGRSMQHVRDLEREPTMEYAVVVSEACLEHRPSCFACVKV